MKKHYLISLVSVVSFSMPLFSSQTNSNSSQNQVESMIAMCGTKISAVDNKSNLFIYPPKPSFLKITENKEWKKQTERIDKIKNHYLGILSQTKDWYKKNNDEVRKISADKMIERSREYVHNCNLFVDSMADLLYWYQDKTPPGGFKNSISASYFNKQFSLAK